MTTPRAVPCKYLRMRPVALVNGAAREGKPVSAAVCESQIGSHQGRVLLDGYDAGQWLRLETCRSCPHYQAVRP